MNESETGLRRHHWRQWKLIGSALSRRHCCHWLSWQSFSMGWQTCDKREDRRRQPFQQCWKVLFPVLFLYRFSAMKSSTFFGSYGRPTWKRTVHLQKWNQNIWMLFIHYALLFFKLRMFQTACIYIAGAFGASKWGFARLVWTDNQQVPFLNSIWN